MEFRPGRSMGILLGGGIALWCSVIAVALAFKGLTSPISLGVVAIYCAAVAFVVMACLFAYWAYGCYTLRYLMDRNALYIIWGNIRQVVPLASIQKLVPGSEMPHIHVEGVSWLGHHVGRAKVPRIGETMFYATHRSKDELLFVVTDGGNYAISVENEMEFGREFASYKAMGPDREVSQVAERSYFAAQPFWEDRVAQAMAGLGIVAFMVLLGYVFHVYPGLPEQLSNNMPTMGGVKILGTKTELLGIPATGCAILLANLALGTVAHSWERMVGYVLLLSAIAAEAILLVGAVSAAR